MCVCVTHPPHAAALRESQLLYSDKTLDKSQGYIYRPERVALIQRVSEILEFARCGCIFFSEPSRCGRVSVPKRGTNLVPRQRKK